jgi:hypothetical protein
LQGVERVDEIMRFDGKAGEVSTEILSKAAGGRAGTQVRKRTLLWNASVADSSCPIPERSTVVEPPKRLTNCSCAKVVDNSDATSPVCWMANGAKIDCAGVMAISSYRDQY